MRGFQKQLVIVAHLISIVGAHPATFYLDQGRGENSNDGDGLSPRTAFADSNVAVKALKPGDTLEIIGTLSNPSYNPTFTFSDVSDPQLWHSENTLTLSSVEGMRWAFDTCSLRYDRTQQPG
jgi:hypothetical protein